MFATKGGEKKEVQQIESDLRQLKGRETKNSTIKKLNKVIQQLKNKIKSSNN